MDRIVFLTFALRTVKWGYFERQGNIERARSGQTVTLGICRNEISCSSSIDLQFISLRHLIWSYGLRATSAFNLLFNS